MPLDYVDRTIEAYDTSPDKYVATTSEMINQQELEMLVSLLPDTTSPILDVGCAYGRDSAVLTALGLKTVGIDMSSELLKRAKEFYPALSFQYMDVRHLDFDDNTFSGVWCYAVLLHLNDEDIMLALKEMHRVLKSGGTIFVSFKEGHGSKDVAETFTSDKSRFYNFKTLDEVRALLEQSGFSISKSYILNERERFGPDKRDLNWVYCFATKS